MSHKMMMNALDHVITRKPEMLFSMGYSPEFISAAIDSYNFEAQGLYGRFDLALKKGVKGFQPVMLEYNAETPTSLLEGSIIQWQWLQENMQSCDQFNFIHEQLIDTWKYFRERTPVDLIHFVCADDAHEDEGNLIYMADTAKSAGFSVKMMNMSDICLGTDEKGKEVFCDPSGEKIEQIFKLYPWEWMSREAPFADFVKVAPVVYEPMWRALLSSKALLPVLSSLYPDHPAVLKCWFTEEEAIASGLSYVKKPILGREGCGVSILNSEENIVSSDELENPLTGYIYQEKAEMLTDRDEKGNKVYAVIGAWVIGEVACGMGIREDKSQITANMSSFLPHYIKD